MLRKNNSHYPPAEMEKSGKNPWAHLPETATMGYSYPAKGIDRGDGRNFVRPFPSETDGGRRRAPLRHPNPRNSWPWVHTHTNYF